MKKVLLTGATGLIGRQTLTALADSGWEIYALVREIPALSADNSRVRWLRGDLFSLADLQRICEIAQAEYLLHLAWFTGENYQQSRVNFAYAAASLQLLQCFQQAGGKRAVCAGTCFEYQFQAAPLSEDSPVQLATPYEKCKHYWRVLGEAFCETTDISFGWGRIFFVYGFGENRNRLGGKLLHNFTHGESVTINSASLIRDYVYVKDIAAAFVSFLSSDVRGMVNICSGAGISLGDFARHYAQALHAENLLILKDEPAEPKIIIGDNSRLRREIGFTPRYSPAVAIAEMAHEMTNAKPH